jgi:serine/threonine-protein kinase
VIDSLLGQGGMGRVYRARDATLERWVALKVLRLDGADAAATAGHAAQRFLREARAAAALEHANTVVIHDVGEVEGTPFIAMELVDGRPLRSYVGDPAVPLETRVRFLADVARALQAAHDCGIIHRDVKPENVMVRRDGAIKVLDFGIARPLDAPDAGGASTARGDGDSGLLGTPRYMAPEQLRGDTLDARTDQFAWGVMAYELLSGQSPWLDTTPALSLTLLSTILADDPVLEEPLRRVCPPHVADTVLRALAKRPPERLPSMADVVKALTGDERAPLPEDPRAEPAHGTSVTAPTRGAPVRTSRASIVAAIALVAAGCMGAFVLSRARTRQGSLASTVSRAPPATPPATSAFLPRTSHPRRVTLGACEEFPSFTPDGRSLVYSAVSGPVEHVVVRTLETGAERTITKGPGWDLAPSVSPDGRLVAYLRSADEELATYVVDIDGLGPPRRIAAGGTRPRFSIDGTAVWCGRKAHPARYDLATAAPTRTLDSPFNAEAPQLRELPDGSVVASYPFANRSSVTGLALFSPSGTMAWLRRASMEEAVAVSPDGRFVIATSQSAANNPELYSVPLAGGEPVSLPTADIRAIKGMDFSRDGKHVTWSACRGVNGAGHFDARGAFVPLGQAAWSESSVAPIARTGKIALISERSGLASLWTVDPAGREAPRLVWPGDQTHAPSDLDVSPDGALAVLEVAESGLVLVRLDDASSRALTTDVTDSAPRFSRDGREVLFTRTEQGDSMHVLAIAVGPDKASARVVIDSPSMLAAPSPVDERAAYLAGADFATRLPTIVDLVTGRTRRLSPSLTEGRYLSIAFSGDGKRVGVIAGEGRFVEVDASTGAVLRSVDSGEELEKLHYVGNEAWVARAISQGNVWMADVDE